MSVIDDMCSKTNSFLNDISRFFTARSLTLYLALGACPCSTTIFINWISEYRLDLNICVDDVKIPTVNNPNSLGVTLIGCTPSLRIRPRLLPIYRPATKSLIRYDRSMIMFLQTHCNMGACYFSCTQYLLWTKLKTCYPIAAQNAKQLPSTYFHQRRVWCN